MRVEFNWTANEKRAKCVELFDSIVTQVLEDHGHPADSKLRATVVDMVAGLTMHRKWLRATYNGDESQHIEAQYRSGVPGLICWQFPEIAPFVNDFTFEHWISAFDRASVQIRAVNAPGLRDSTTSVVFNIPEELNDDWECDHEAASYYPEETGKRLDKLLSNLVVLAQAMERYRGNHQVV